MNNIPNNIIAQINNWAEHQLIWHGVCVWLYSDLISNAENR